MTNILQCFYTVAFSKITVPAVVHETKSVLLQKSSVNLVNLMTKVTG